MKRYLIFTGLCAAALSLYSCQKTSHTVKPPVIDSPVVYPDYMAMKPGNYWIYAEYQLDSANVATASGILDSVYVEKDTDINGHTYHKLCSARPGMAPTGASEFLRDSLGYVVNDGGRIRFASQNFTDTFKAYSYYNPVATPDTLQIIEKMGLKDESVTVPAGTFVTSAFRRMIFYPPSDPHGANHSYDYRYALNIGLVSQVTGWYYNWPNHFEEWLIRYHVQ